MPKLSADLLREVRFAFEFVDQIIGQLAENREWKLDLGEDPIADIYRVTGEIERRLHAEKIKLPILPNADVEPMGHLYAWRDYLRSLLPKHPLEHVVFKRAAAVVGAWFIFVVAISRLFDHNLPWWWVAVIALFPMALFAYIVVGLDD